MCACETSKNKYVTREFNGEKSEIREFMNKREAWFVSWNLREK